jgi:hypothetical protein
MQRTIYFPLYIVFVCCCNSLYGQEFSNSGDYLLSEERKKRAIFVIDQELSTNILCCLGTTKEHAIADAIKDARDGSIGFLQFSEGRHTPLLGRYIDKEGKNVRIEYYMEPRFFSIPSFLLKVIVPQTMSLASKEKHKDVKISIRNICFTEEYFYWYNTALLNYLELHPDLLKTFCNGLNDCPQLLPVNSPAYSLHSRIRSIIATLESEVTRPDVPGN